MGDIRNVAQKLVTNYVLQHIQWRRRRKLEPRICIHHYNEPWVRGTPGVAWEFKDSVPIGRYDGAWQTDHYSSQVGQLWV